MITIDQIKEELLPKLIKLSVMNQLVQTIYVDSNPATVEYSEVVKEDNLIKEIKNTNQYKLRKHRMIVKYNGQNSIIISDEVKTDTIIGGSVCECMSMRINRGFMDVVDSLSKLEKYKWTYFNQNLLQRMFFKREKNQLVHKLIEIGSDSNYVIISENIYKVISKSNFFESNNNTCDSIIKNVGKLKIDQIILTVYVDKEMNQNKVYFGKYDSVAIILNKNLHVSEIKSTKDKQTILVEVEFEFIQREAIKCLYL